MANRPYTAVPATRSSKRALRLKQNLIIGALIGGFLLGPIGFYFAVQARGNVPEVPPAIPTATVAFAELVARDYLAGRPTDLPTTGDVPQDLGFPTGGNQKPLPGATLTFDRWSPAEVAGVPVTQVRFRVASGENLYNLTIVTTRDSRGRDLLAALPALTPAVFAPSGSFPTPAPTSQTPGFVDTAPDAVRTAVAAWAAAFAAGDAAQLKILVGGGAAAPDGDYVGLSGFELRGAPTISWGVLSADGTAGYVRVTLLLSDPGANGFAPSNSYDLLVQDWGTANPRVVAWGPPGSGPTLEPYENNTSRL